MTEAMIENLIKERYCVSDQEKTGDIWANVSKRVSDYIGNSRTEAKDFYDMIYNKEFLPNSPTLMNAGTETPMLSACFYLPISDCISNGKDGIFDQVKNAAIVFKFGGGVGLNFSNLRPSGSKVKSTNGVSSGVISFMKNFNTMTETIKQGGKRRGALMGCLDITHPEIKDFITCKNTEGDLSNFNISVKLTDDFMDAIEDNSKEELELFNLIIDGIYKNGEPGILFKDEIERYNPRPDIGELNPNPSLRKGTRIITTNGIFPIEKLSNISFNVPSYIQSSSPATCKLSGKNKQLYEIVLNTNKKYYATAEHKWLIVQNDGSLIKKTTLELNKDDKLPFTNNYSMEYGNDGTYDDGFLIGWNLGDGWITQRSDNNYSQYGFVFGHIDISNGIYDYVKSIINKKCQSNIIGCKRISKYSNNEFVEINSTHEKLFDFFTHYNIYNKENGISDYIFSSTTNQFRKGLIDGLFSSDGCIVTNDKYSHLEIKSKHEKLIDDIMDLIGFYGIKSVKSIEHVSNVVFPNGKLYNKTYTNYKLQITKKNLMLFKNIFTLTHKEKQLKISNVKFNIKNKDFSNYIKIKNILKTNIFEDVWDLTVDDNSHSFRISQCYTGNCAEALLTDFESCNLGSINWSCLVNDNKSQNWEDNINWELYDYLIRTSVIFLNNVIDKNKYPLQEIDTASKITRKIGLGGMGFHDMLLKLGIPYDSEKALEVAKTMENNLKLIAQEESEKHKYNNASLTTIAPTGTISIIANVSSGIEPVFNWVITRKDSLGEHYIVHPIFKQELKKLCKDDKEYDNVIKHCHENGTIQDIGWLSVKFKELFKNAMDINWKQHIRMQAIFQTNGVDMSISKTINLPNNATKSDIREAIFMAWKLQCKGLTIYRSGSRDHEVLNLKRKEIEPKIQLLENGEENLIIDPKKDNVFKRPRQLFGATYKVQSGCGKLYVTINERNGKPYEVFIQSGGSGGCEAGNQALGRTISLALRNGGNIHNIIKQLCKVKCPAALRNVRSEGKSCSDIVGKLITESIPDDDEDDDPSPLQHEKLEQCPSCKDYTLVRESGCKICHSCGYNKCG